MDERLATMFDFDPSGALISSLIIMVIVAVLAIVVGILAKRADPTKAPTGLLLFADYFCEKLQNWVHDNMGDNWDNFPGYFMGLASYLFLAFIWSITGLPGPIDNLFVPLSLAIVMLILIHYTALKYQHLQYFHRYVEPIFLFLPINIISQITPVLSTTLRMFGNGLSGTIIIGLVTWALGIAGNVYLVDFISGETTALAYLAVIPVGVLNLYFALFSGFIQTLVFCSLNAVWIANERPEDYMGVEVQATRGPELKAQAI
ncbi:MAG: F0F1 ATP synthase subunit A [Bacillota bacterium]|nr:F0F1 ATP synthase subunit A [Bacillota bacterium]